MHKVKVTDDEVGGLVCQLLKALAYLHARCVAHLDCRVRNSQPLCTYTTCEHLSLQPSNILVHVNQHVATVKLTDFGAARHFGCRHQTLPLEHSYESPSGYYFLAPEAFQQLPLAAPADIW